MTHVGRGSRLTLRVGDRSVALRALADLDLSGNWTLPVLALVTGADGPGQLEITSEHGVARVPAELVLDGRGLVLRHAGGQPPVAVQRRSDVRGALALPLRAAVLDARARADLADLAFTGATLTISAGGASLAAAAPAPAAALPPGARLFLELELPDGRLVPAVLGLVDAAVDGLRGPFVDIAAADRERLARLVFAEQRRQIVARRHLQR